MWVLKDCFEIALNTGHGCLELMRHVLRELSLEDILLAPCGLQTLIYLDDTLGDLAQLIVGECREVLRLQTLVVVGTRSEDAELGDVCTQAVDKAVEHEGEQHYDHQGKPDEVLIGQAEPCAPRCRRA